MGLSKKSNFLLDRAPQKSKGSRKGGNSYWFHAKAELEALPSQHNSIILLVYETVK
jgi:hypothetical protein